MVKRSKDQKIKRSKDQKILCITHYAFLLFKSLLEWAWLTLLDFVRGTWCTKWNCRGTSAMGEQIIKPYSHTVTQSHSHTVMQSYSHLKFRYSAWICSGICMVVMVVISYLPLCYPLFSLLPSLLSATFSSLCYPLFSLLPSQEPCVCLCAWRVILRVRPTTPTTQTT